MYAVSDASFVPAFRMDNRQNSTFLDRLIYPQAGTTWRNIVEIADVLSCDAGIVLPANLQQVRTKHPGISTSANHVEIIGIAS